VPLLHPCLYIIRNRSQKVIAFDFTQFLTFQGAYQACAGGCMEHCHQGNRSRGNVYAQIVTCFPALKPHEQGRNSSRGQVRIRINWPAEMIPHQLLDPNDVIHAIRNPQKDLKAPSVIPPVSMEVACPQCGNPNLDVDEGSSVVYCKKCGFAVRVDPQTGNVTPLNEGGAGAGPQMPEAYGQRSIFGMDPTTFFLGSTAVLLLLSFMAVLNMTTFILLESIIVIIWWYNR